jgi:ubiquinone/menaquinone biosynthesis C-methylase UbiE
MSFGVEQQKESYEDIYANSENWSFWDDPHPLTRYILERRMRIGIEYLMKLTNTTPADWDVLVVCGGVGGEGTVLANMEFRSVTVSDISENALQVCRVRDSRLKTILLNGENLDLPDNSYDLVIVQDGLHHLPRPVLGLTEMIRVAKKAAIFIEPHTGIVADVLGQEWEDNNGTINYVFRWDKTLLEQTIKSYILQMPCHIKAIRLWNHNIVMSKLANLFGGDKTGLFVVKLAYFLLDAIFGKIGNMMVGVIVLESSDSNIKAR